MNASKSDISLQASGGNTTLSRLARHYARIGAGFITPLEYMFLCIDRGMGKIFKHDPHIAARLTTRRMINELRKAGCVEKDFYRLRDAKIPLLSIEDAIEFFPHVMNDDFYCYMHLNDSYLEKDINELFYLLVEGPYGLVNDKVNVTVRPGDIVIDAGAWIGDFAAYASAKSAKVYAFEPLEANYSVLLKTAGLNGGIVPVKKSLGSSCARVRLDGVSMFAVTHKDDAGDIEMVTLDDFVRENNLPRVDFIKADIEGFERHMLAGAQETLARFAPKLALCTYHLPDDPQVMAGLIKQANPKYDIVQKRCKLFASVPE